MSSLETLRFATREQLQKLHNLGSDRNALKVLNQMKEYLHVQTHNGVNVYYLNKLGRELIGAETEMKWTLQAEHHLLRNDLYIHYNCPDDWQVEEQVTFKVKESAMSYEAGKLVQPYKEMYIIPDATFTVEGKYHLAEVDRTQSMADNKKKIENYALLTPAIYEQYKHMPIIVFYTVTEIRREKLKELCRENKVSCVVYTKEDLR